MKDETLITLQASNVLGAKYDRACKELFLNKEIIAPILKEVIPEYKNCTVEEIISLILSDSINDDSVDGSSVLAMQMQTEMNSLTDKIIRYDARFKAVNPLLSTEIITFYLHFDIEVQNDYRTSYPVIKRGIYYAAREISSQLGILTEDSDYNSLQKVYSIWICNENIPKDLCNTVTSYTITKNDVIGKTEEPEEDYDLMTVIVIRRGNNEGKEEIFDYLTGVFNYNLEKISRHTDVSKNEKILEGVKTLSGLGQSIATRNFQQGMQQSGISKEGYRRGR